MEFGTRGKAVLVSPATKGIRPAIATRPAREDARIIANGRTEKSANEALTRIHQAVPDAVREGYAGDLASPDNTAKLRGQFAGADILVSYPGVFEPKPVEDNPEDDWRRYFEVNVRS